MDALPDVGADGRDARSDGGRDAQQPGHDGGLQPIRQHRQHVQLAVFGLATDDGHKVAMALQERNLVDAQGRERRERIPINGLGNGAVQDTEERSGGDVFFGLHIAEGAGDQLHNQMALVGLGMQSFGVIPVERLGGAGMVIAEGTAETLGPDA